MAKVGFLLLAVLLASALTSAQTMGQISGGSQPDLKTPFVGSTLTCSQPEKIVIPKPVVQRAKLKARLLNLLRESLYDDAKGIVNIGREKEIKKLANKLNTDKQN